MDIYLTASQFGKYSGLATSTSVNNCYLAISWSLPPVAASCAVGAGNMTKVIIVNAVLMSAIAQSVENKIIMTQSIFKL